MAWNSYSQIDEQTIFHLAAMICKNVRSASSFSKEATSTTKESSIITFNAGNCTPFFEAMGRKRFYLHGISCLMRTKMRKSHKMTYLFEIDNEHLQDRARKAAMLRRVESNFIRFLDSNDGELLDQYLFCCNHGTGAPVIHEKYTSP